MKSVAKAATPKQLNLRFRGMRTNVGEGSGKSATGQEGTGEH